MAALSILQQSEPAAWLAPPPHLSRSARTASQFLFELSSAYSVNCPLSKLLTDQFDVEQIWQQIDLQTTPLLASLRRRLRNIERRSGSAVLLQQPQLKERSENGNALPETVAFEVAEKNESKSEEEDTSDEAGEEDDLEMPVEGETNTVDDKFFKLSDMERFLDEAEAPQGSADAPSEDASEGDISESEDGDMQVDDVAADAEDNSMEDDEDIKYGDFFGVGEKRRSKKQVVLGSDEGMNKDLINQTDLPGQRETMTTHERDLAKIRKRIEQLEKANLDTKMWTMQGEVSANKRPKNSALEVELDFEHNARPPPVITEEVTASLEDIIRQRIAEANFDDVQRKPSLLSAAPKEQIELDESKSQKGLGEIYEAEFMQTSGLAPISVSPADIIRKEATNLFKSLCVRLDALSHFHFTPKPVIEDMAVHLDVPALAMEEVAPLMVSDAQMLAPEEVFKGEGVVKAEAELTREDRKRLRARRKEKLKVEKKRKETFKNSDKRTKQSGKSVEAGAERKKKSQQSEYAKSTKVFDQLDQSKGRIQSTPSKDSNRPPFLKL